MKSIDWKILSVLYEKKSITKAAEEIYMTQSALTKRLKAIEAEWDIVIVERSSTGIRFTEDGRYLCKKAKIMLDFLQEIEQHFSEEANAKEVLRLGIPNSVARLHLSGIIRHYKEHHNNIQFQTIISSSDQLVGKLVEGAIDIAIVCGDFEYLGEQTELFTEKLYALTPRGVQLDDLEQYPLIESYLNPRVRGLVNQWWKNYFGSIPHAAHNVPYHDIAIQMVENGLGITLIFGDNWDLDVEKTQLIPLYDSNERQVERPVKMLMSGNCFLSTAITEFIGTVEDYYRVNRFEKEEPEA